MVASQDVVVGHVAHQEAHGGVEILPRHGGISPNGAGGLEEGVVDAHIELGDEISVAERRPVRVVGVRHERVARSHALELGLGTDVELVAEAARIDATDATELLPLGHCVRAAARARRLREGGARGSPANVQPDAVADAVHQLRPQAALGELTQQRAETLRNLVGVLSRRVQ